MQIPENVNELLETTPFGRVTIDIHRAYGSTQMVKARTRQQVKTSTVEECGALIGQYLGLIAEQKQSGHLDIEISFKDGAIKFTIIEAFVD